MKVNVAVAKSVRPAIVTIRSTSERLLPYWIAAGITALFSVVYAYLFKWSEELSYSWLHVNPAWAFVLTPLAMLASTYSAYFLAPGASGSGIPQLLASVEVSHEQHSLLKRLLNIRVIFVKALGSCICVAGGGVTGREGPMLQISASIFSLVQKYWPKFFKKSAAPNLQSMILAGGAAGLASAFNTPLGGVIFAIEELAKVHISQIRTHVFHAVIMAGILAQMLLGNYLYFGKIQVVGIQPHEIIPIIVATALIGCLGAYFGRAVVGCLDWRAKMGFTSKSLMTFAFGVGVAAITYVFHDSAIGSGRAVIVDLLSHSDSTAPYYLGFVRGIGNLLTYAGGVVGGVFAPALSTGAAFGSWFSELSPGFNHQLWALTGMVAFLTGVTRTPFTSLILVLEMTDTHDIIIYLMLAAIIAQGAAKIIDPISFYEHVSHRMIHGRPPQKNHAH
jgi:H+/Cl- antiporter ClcA